MAKHSPTKSRRQIVDEHLKDRVRATVFIIVEDEYLLRSTMTGSIDEAYRMIDFMTKESSAAHMKTELKHV